MAQFRLVGECNRCGLCCYDGDLRCNYLAVKMLGMPGGTTCTVYANRYPGMPIMLVDGTGKVAALAQCAHGTPTDDMEIMAKGIGKGCSLKVVNG